MAKKIVDVSLKVDTKDVESASDRLRNLSKAVESCTVKFKGEAAALDKFVEVAKGDELSANFIDAAKRANAMRHELDALKKTLSEIKQEEGPFRGDFTKRAAGISPLFTEMLKDTRKQIDALNNLAGQVPAGAADVIEPFKSQLKRVAAESNKIMTTMQAWFTQGQAAPGGVPASKNLETIKRAFGIGTGQSYRDLLEAAPSVTYEKEPAVLKKKRLAEEHAADFDRLEKLKEETEKAAKEKAIADKEAAKTAGQVAGAKKRTKKVVEAADIQVEAAKVEEAAVTTQTTAEVKADATKKRGRKKKEEAAAETTTKATEEEAKGATISAKDTTEKAGKKKAESKKQEESAKKTTQANSEEAEAAAKSAEEAKKKAKEDEAARKKKEREDESARKKKEREDESARKKKEREDESARKKKEREDAAEKKRLEPTLAGRYQSEQLQTQARLADISRATRAAHDTQDYGGLRNQLFNITKEMLHQDELLRKSKSDQKDIQGILASGKLSRKEAAEYEELLNLELKKTLNIHEAIKNLESQQATLKKDQAAAEKKKSDEAKKNAAEEAKLLKELQAEEDALAAKRAAEAAKQAVADKIAGRRKLVLPAGVSGDPADPKALTTQAERQVALDKTTDAIKKQTSVVDELRAAQSRLNEEIKEEGLHSEIRKAIAQDMRAVKSALTSENSKLNALLRTEASLRKMINRDIREAEALQRDLPGQLAAGGVYSMSSAAVAAGQQNPMKAMGLAKGLEAINRQMLTTLEKLRREQSLLLANQKMSVDTQKEALAVEEKISELSRVQAHVQGQINKLEEVRGRNLKQVQANFTAVRQIFFSMLIGVTSILFPLQRLLDKAAEAERAMNALNRQARLEGLGGGKMEESVRNMDIVKNGLVSIAEAGKTVRNLMRIGFTPDEAVNSARKITEIAIENKQSALTLGQAIVSTSEGFRQELSTLADAGGITKNISVIYKEFAATLGINAKQLTQRQKALALQKAVDYEATLSAGALEEAVFTLGGAIDATRGAMDRFSQSIGLQLKPVVVGVLGVVRELLGLVQSLINYFPGLTKFISILGVVGGSAALVFGSLAGVMKLGLGLGYAVNFAIQLVAETLFARFSPAVTTASASVQKLNADMLNLSYSTTATNAALSTSTKTLAGATTASTVYALGWIGVIAALASVAYYINNNVSAAERSSKSTGALIRDINDLGVSADKTRGKMKSLSEALQVSDPMADGIDKIKSKFYELDEVQNSTFYKMRIEAAKTADELKSVFKDINAEMEASLKSRASAELLEAQKKRADLSNRLESFTPTAEEAAGQTQEFIRRLGGRTKRPELIAKYSGMTPEQQLEIIGQVQELLTESPGFFSSGGNSAKARFGRSLLGVSRPSAALRRDDPVYSTEQQRRYDAAIKEVEAVTADVISELKKPIQAEDKRLVEKIDMLSRVMRGELSGATDPTKPKPTEVIRLSDILGRAQADRKLRLTTAAQYKREATRAIQSLQDQIRQESNKEGLAPVDKAALELSAGQGGILAALGKSIAEGTLFDKTTSADRELSLLSSVDARRGTSFSSEIGKIIPGIQKSQKFELAIRKMLDAEMRKAEKYRMQQTMAGYSRIRTLGDFLNTTVLQVDPGDQAKTKLIEKRMGDILPSVRGIVDIQEDLARLQLRKEQISKEMSGPKAEGVEDDPALKAELVRLENQEDLLKEEEARSVTLNKLVASTLRSREKLFSLTKSLQEGTDEGRAATQKQANLLIDENRKLLGQYRAQLDAENIERIQAMNDTLKSTDRQIALETITKEHKERLQDAEEKSEAFEKETIKGKKQTLEALKAKLQVYADTKKALEENTLISTAMRAVQLRDLKQGEAAVEKSIKAMERDISIQTFEEQTLKVMGLRMTKLNNSYAPVLERLQEYKRLRDEYATLLSSAKTPAQEQAIRQAMESADASRGKLVPELFEDKGFGLTAKAQQLKQYREYYEAHWEELGDSYTQYHERLREISYQTDRFQRGLQVETANALKESFVSGYADVLSRTKTFSDMFYDIFKGMMDRLNKLVMEKAVEESFLGGLFDSIAGSLTGMVSNGAGGGSTAAAGGGGLADAFSSALSGGGGDAFSRAMDSPGLRAPSFSPSVPRTASPSVSRAAPQVQINIQAMDGASVQRVLTSPAGQKAVMANINTINQQYGEMNKG